MLTKLIENWQKKMLNLHPLLRRTHGVIERFAIMESRVSVH